MLYFRDKDTHAKGLVMAKAQKEKKSSWIVRLRCVVTKEVVCDDCTEDQANRNPWEFAGDEREIEQVDWDVLSVEENT